MATADKSFAAFLKSPEGQAACGADLTACLAPVVDTIGTIGHIAPLLNWARDHHPDQVAQCVHVWEKFIAWIQEKMRCEATNGSKWATPEEVQAILDRIESQIARLDEQIAALNRAPTKARELRLASVTPITSAIKTRAANGGSSPAQHAPFNAERLTVKIPDTWSGRDDYNYLYVKATAGRTATLKADPPDGWARCHIDDEGWATFEVSAEGYVRDLSGFDGVEEPAGGSAA